MNTPPIYVVGAGIIGLTTAITLTDAGHRVHILTAEHPTDTTSAAAGALWGPWLVEPRDTILRWAAHTLATLTALATEPGTGVRIASGIDAARENYPPPDWAHLQPQRRPCTPGELPDGYRHGTRYHAPLVDMPTHLTYLTHRFHRAGGTVTRRTVTNLPELLRETDIVINCTGSGSSALVPDADLYPIRGHHVITTNPGLTDFLEVDTGTSSDLIAIYPHQQHVIIGGTAQPHQWDRTPDNATTQAILTRAIHLEPRLADAQILGTRVGLRPTRSHVRVESDPTHPGLHHNYGHGGAGVSLAWGSADDTLTRISR